MTTLPPIIRALNTEMIRDGGSFAAFFEDEGGRRYILFTRVKLVDLEDHTRRRLDYELPTLIDCNPAKRPSVTAQRRYSELSGPKIPITWGQARTFMALTSGLADGLSEWRRDWLNCMRHVVANDGAVPPGMETIIKRNHP